MRLSDLHRQVTAYRICPVKCFSIAKHIRNSNIICGGSHLQKDPSLHYAPQAVSAHARVRPFISIHTHLTTDHHAPPRGYVTLHSHLDVKTWSDRNLLAINYENLVLLMKPASTVAEMHYKLELPQRQASARDSKPYTYMFYLQAWLGGRPLERGFYC